MRYYLVSFKKTNGTRDSFDVIAVLANDQDEAFGEAEDILVRDGVDFDPDSLASDGGSLADLV